MPEKTSKLSASAWLMPTAELDRLIFEDAPAGDLTTEALNIGHAPAELVLDTRQPMVLAGVEVAAAMFERAGLLVQMHAASGTRLASGSPVLTASGTASAMHTVWKSAKNLMEYLSGIATATRTMVDAAATVDPSVRIALTRKTFPGSRRLSQLAAVVGGGIIHRAGLSETVLVFAEHRVFAPDASLATLAAQLRHALPEHRLAIEVASLEEARAAIDAGFGIIQLEKFSLPDIRQAAGYAREHQPTPLVAATGGITPENVATHVQMGAQLIVTSWPYAARPREFSTHLSLAAPA